MWWKKKDKAKSNITVEFSDQEGRKHKLDVPKEKMDEWIKTGQARRVFRVLIRGPWDGIKEDHWEIDEDDIKFVGEDDTAHAICHYENGVPQYAYVSKRFWDHFDEISAIMSKPGYTQEQKALEVQKILD